MKKAIYIIIALLLAVAVFVFIGSFAARDSFGGGKKKAPENIIYIGVYEPLNGENANGGRTETLGIRYANSLYPSLSLDGVDYEIKLVESDNAADSPDAPYAAQRLVSGGVCAVLGSYSSKLTAAGLPIFEAAGLPLISLSGTNEKLAGSSAIYYTLSYADSFQNGVTVNYAAGQELRHAAVLTLIGDAYSKETGKLFAESFAALGGEISEFGFQLGQENFRPLLTEIKSSGADFVYMLSGAREAGFLLAQAREEHLGLPIMGPQSWDCALLLSEDAADLKNVTFTTPFQFGQKASQEAAEFAVGFSAWISKDGKRIEENGGSSLPSAGAALGYDGYMALIKAIKSADSTQPKELNRALKVLSFPGATGEISFGERGEAKKNLAYIKAYDASSRSFEVIQTSSVTGKK